MTHMNKCCTCYKLHFGVIIILLFYPCITQTVLFEQSLFRIRLIILKQCQIKFAGGDLYS